MNETIDTRIQDPEKAHEMAIAGNAYRSDAASLRGLAKIIEEYRSGLTKALAWEILYPYDRDIEEDDDEDNYDIDDEDIGSELGQKTFQHPGFEAYFRQTGKSSLDVKIGNEWQLDDYILRQAAYADHEDEDLRDEHYYSYDPAKNYHDIAVDADNKAKQLEYWAGILHDHPVSEAYKKSLEVELPEDGSLVGHLMQELFRPNVEFNPEGLVKLKGRAAYLKKGVKSRSQLIQKATRRNSGIGWPVLDNVERDEEGKKLLSDDSTTIGDIRKFAVKKMEEQKQEWQLAYERCYQILEDVRSGRASL